MIKIYLCIYGQKKPEQQYMYIIESPTLPLETRLQERCFAGENPEFSHLKIFGFLVYIHIPKKKRSKLDPSWKKGLFVGYSEQSKSYRIYIPGYRQIELSRYVNFDEDTSFIKQRKTRKMKRSMKLPELQKVLNQLGTKKNNICLRIMT